MGPKPKKIIDKNLHATYKELYGKGIPVNKLYDNAWIVQRISEQRDANLAEKVNEEASLPVKPIDEEAKKTFFDEEEGFENKPQIMTNDMKITREKLNSQKRVTFHVPLGLGEKSGVCESVTINGYRIVVMKGMMVLLPMDVYKQLAKKYQVEESAGAAMRLDRSEKITQALS